MGKERLLEFVDGRTWDEVHMMKLEGEAMHRYSSRY